MTPLTLELMKKLWPNGDSHIPGLVEGIVATAPAIFAKYGIATNLTAAHAMAQFSHECGAGTEVVEILNYSAVGLVKTWPSRFNTEKAIAFAHNPQKIANEVYNGRMGNRLGTSDGWLYRGRGPAQTTGREAYGKLGELLNLDLLNHPEQINTPINFLECGVADFVKLCNCLEPAQRDDVVTVTHRLNGGTIGLAQREQWLARWKAALGITTGKGNSNEATS